jgi:hypothetical protein
MEELIADKLRPFFPGCDVVTTKRNEGEYEVYTTTITNPNGKWVELGVIPSFAKSYILGDDIGFTVRREITRLQNLLK